MAARGKRRTRLGEIFRIFDVTVGAVVAAAERIAKQTGARGGISRQYLGELLREESNPTAATIRLLVMAMREVTGYAIRASDMFPLEPAAPEGMPLLRTNGRTVALRVSSRASRNRRLALAEQNGSSDGEAVETLYVRYGVLLRSIAMRRYGIPPDDADALVHDAFIAYLQRHTTIREVKPWLMGAVSNASKTYWRQRKREVPLPQSYDERADPDSVKATDQWEWRVTVAAAFVHLGDKCKQTLRRYYWGEQSKETIAESLATSPGYVRNLLMTCRRRMKQFLDGIGRWIP